MAMALADRVLKTIPIVFTMRLTIIHVVGERNVFSPNPAIIIPVIHVAGS